MMRKRSAIWATALLAVTLLAAACSSAGTSGGGTGSSSGGSTPKGSPIPVGVIGTYSGPVASSIAGARDAIEAWADWVNATGGINGHPVKLYVYDDGGNVSTSLTDVKSLVEQDHVVALVGQASANDAPWAAYVKQQGIPVVGGNTASDTYLSNDDFFSVGGNLVASFYGVSAVAKQSGFKLGDLYCAELPACAATVTLLQAFGHATGARLTYSLKVAASSPDFTAPCQGLKSAGVQSYTLGLASTTLHQVVAACGQQGVKATPIVAGVGDSTLPSDPVFNGLEVIDAMFPFFDSSTQATQQFQSVMKKYAPSLGTAALPMNPAVTQAYASGLMFEAAIKASGASTVTPESIKDGLYSFKGETLGGLTVPLSFTKGKPSPHNCYFTYAIKNGKYVEPNGLKYTCVPDKVIDPILSALNR